MSRNRLVPLLLIAALTAGCAATPSADDPSPATTAPAAAKPLAYVDGRPVTDRRLLEPMIEASGGRILSEIILDRAIADRLARQGITLTSRQINAEKQRVLKTLSPDPDTAVRLLKDLRRRRGLGEKRFAALLRRNAGLRLLVRGRITVSPAALHHAYQLAYGPRYQARLIVTATVRKAQALREQIASGSSFTDLAIEHSTDSSAARGGLLSPISPADPSYPKAVRDTLARLKPGQLSDVIAVSNGFALLQLVRKIAGKSVKFDDVKKELRQQVLARAQRLRMRQLARTLLKQANVVVLDPALSDSWNRRKQLLLGP